jgi:hypothetical protein
MYCPPFNVLVDLNGTMINKKVISKMPKVLEALVPGVLQ